MRARRFLLPLAVFLSVSIPVASLVASPSGAEWIETRKLTASDARPFDEFGCSVAIDGNTAIVGALHGEDAVDGSGSAYLFDVTTGNQLHELTAADAALQDVFGFSVAVSGSTAIVGAWGNSDAGYFSGSAYLFDVTTGDQLYKLTASDAGASDYFGYSVAVSGNTAIVGARYNDDAGNNSGSAYLFDVTTGNQLHKLTASDAATEDWFGCSVAISGNTAIVGARYNDDAGNKSGSAYLFDVTTGAQLHKLTSSDAATEDYFGDSVAVSDNTAIVGAWGDDDGGTKSGSAYLFDVTSGNQLHKLTASDAAEADTFGTSVAISGNRAIIGAYGDDDAGNYSGSAYLFDVTTGNQLHKLTASDAAEADFFGTSVAISGNTAVVGATLRNDIDLMAGSVYLFIPEPSTLILLATAGLLACGWRKRRR